MIDSGLKRLIRQADWTVHVSIDLAVAPAVAPTLSPCRPQNGPHTLPYLAGYNHASTPTSLP